MAASLQVSPPLDTPYSKWVMYYFSLTSMGLQAMDKSSSVVH